MLLEARRAGGVRNAIPLAEGRERSYQSNVSIRGVVFSGIFFVSGRKSGYCPSTFLCYDRAAVAAISPHATMLSREHRNYDVQPRDSHGYHKEALCPVHS